MGNVNGGKSENHLPMSVDFFFSDFLMTTVAENDFPTSDFGLRTIEDPILLSQSKISGASLAKPNH